jgi:transposase
VLAYQSGDYTMNCRKYQISKYSLIDWMKRFEKSGIEGLKKSTSWKRYSKELKEAAVRDYLSGKYSQYEIVRKYEISSRSVLRWVERYNSHRIKGVERKVKLYDKGEKNHVGRTDSNCFILFREQ